jgi:hypothetical protein
MFCGIVAKLCQTQMLALILMLANNIIMEILIQYLIHPFCLGIDLWMEGGVKF